MTARSEAQLDIVGSVERGHGPELVGERLRRSLGLPLRRPGDPAGHVAPGAAPAPVAVRRVCVELDDAGRPARTKEGRLVDPHAWTPAADPAWLVCARCGAWQPVTEAADSAARWEARRVAH